ncbi:Peptidase A1 domain-containing protein [Aphelenchoides besseyi]|nr:Peptidase A1 domain-containing protein [Aphelenchoides besseyi]
MFKFSSFIVLLICVVSAFSFDIKKNRAITGKIHQRNAAELKAYHRHERAKSILAQKDYVPAWPKEVITSNIYIGGSKQRFTVSVESGSDKAWVLDVSYPYVQPNIPTFDVHAPNNTAIASGDFVTETADYVAAGDAYDDVFLLEFCEPSKQRFGSVTGLYSAWLIPLFEGPVAGVLGLAWNPDLINDPVTAETAPILNIFNGFNETSSPRYYLQVIWQDNVSGLPGWWGISFGTWWNEVCDTPEITSAPLSYFYGNLSFQIDSFGFGDENVDGGWAQVDSGLPIIAVTYDAFKLINDVIKAEYDYDSGIYSTPCNTRRNFDDLVFTINGVEVRVPSYTYIVDLGLGDGNCVLLVSEQSLLATSFALGIPFYYHHCIKFDIDHSAIAFHKHLRW